MRVLTVEDNPELLKLVANGLRSAGYQVDTAQNVADARTALADTSYAALILDLGLPDEDGTVLLKELRRKQNPLPVIVLTARSSVNDRVSGLQDGADDYLIKPFAFDELKARLEAILRRPNQMLGTSLRVGNVTFDTVSKQVFVEDIPQHFSARESTIIELLLRRSGKVVPKKVIEDELYGVAGDFASNAIEVYIHRTRKQLADAGANVKIHTIRGVGYMATGDK
jgi:two-component system response regulator TctD